MANIFESGTFSSFRFYANLNESMEFTKKCIDGSGKPTKTTVFLSHKHDDLDDLKDVIGFLKTRYDVIVYIDSKDPNMPINTSGETATRIKKIINESDRFLLLATEKSIESKWCNWELGYGDALKYKDKIAIFPIKPKGSCDIDYKGNEYMQIYPYVKYVPPYKLYYDGKLLEEGYYVYFPKQMYGYERYQLLKKWFENPYSKLMSML